MNPSKPIVIPAAVPGAPARFTARLGDHREAVEAAMQRIVADDIPGRIGRRDHTVWRAEPDAIADRLGWLDIAARIRPELPRLHAMRAAAWADGLRRVLLVGMGGSSLAPEVFARTFGTGRDGLELEVLDSTHPDAVRASLSRHDPATTLFVVATKSGGTIETLSLFKAAYAHAVDALGAEEAGRRFVAITDPDSELEAIGRRLYFRDILISDPDIGGRYSALSHFGLAPAALIGADIDAIAERAIRASAEAVQPDGVAAWLGTALGTLAMNGRDKLTLVLPDALASVGDWIEQLVAESTGKDGTGILPVVGEHLGSPERYGPDRVFVRLELGGGPGSKGSERAEAEKSRGVDSSGRAERDHVSGHQNEHEHDGEVERRIEHDAEAENDSRLDALADAGHPVVTLGLDDRLEVGAHFVIWEMATAIAGHVLGVQPFDQPNVESAKIAARSIVNAFRASGRLPDEESVPPEASALEDFLDLGASTDSALEPGAYIGIHAFLNPTADTTVAIDRLRAALRTRTRAAVTIGFGPRFLHSTGQLHKGDAGRGRFVQLFADAEGDLEIPDEPGGESSAIGFGTLFRAQALGDAAALRSAGRTVLRIHLGREDGTAAGITRLADLL